MRFVRRAAFVAVISLAALHTARAQQTAKPGLQRLLEAELARFPGKAGIWVKHLTLGEEAAVHADDSFNSASVIHRGRIATRRRTATRPTGSAR
jgi:hypothetical protein